jgi:hypothetical protein
MNCAKISDDAASLPVEANVRFHLAAPGARSVYVAIFFGDGSTPSPLPVLCAAELAEVPDRIRHLVPLRETQPGLWCGELPLMPDRHDYLFLVDSVWTRVPNAAQVCRAAPTGPSHSTTPPEPAAAVGAHSLLAAGLAVNSRWPEVLPHA